MALPRILFVLPTAWDLRQLERLPAAVRNRYRIEMGEPSDADCSGEFDVVAYIAELARRGGIDGVASSSDYPGATTAAAVATRLGLPGPTPAAVIRCSHKYYARLAGREAVPDATPDFRLVDPSQPDGGPSAAGLAYPCFIKPVKGAFSVMTRRLDRQEDLLEFLARDAVREFAFEYLALFNQLVATLTDYEINGSWFLAEELLYGTQVTLEGYEFDGSVEILGVVDSIMHPGTGSFARFDYPSALRPEVQERMAEISRRVIAHLGLRNAMFNIEMIYTPASDDIKIVEINPRLCGQFADLYQLVDGVHGYEVALALATGERPPRRRGEGAFRAATSFPLRTFQPVRVSRVPDAARIAAVEAAHRGVTVWWECEAGQELSDFEHFEDGFSSRYGVVNLGGDDRFDLRRRLESVLAALDFRLDPIAPETAPGS